MLKKIFNENEVRRNTSVNIFLNPFSYIKLRKHKDIVQHCDNIMVDGQFLVNILNFFCKKKFIRKSFDMTSLAPIVFEEAVDSNKSIYFIGSDQQSITSAVNRFKASFPDMKIYGYRNGYFSSESERNKTIHEIALLNPDIIVVGMGTPLQERFLVDLKLNSWNGEGYTCGGFFHQSAKKLNYYPEWIDRMQLRWLYRIYDEPKLFKRYAIDYLKFVFVFFIDLLKFKRN